MTRMTRWEKQTVDRIDGVVRSIGSLQPANPADVKAKSANLNVATEAARQVAKAIVAWRSEDREAVDAYLSNAERISAARGEAPQ